MLATGAQYYGGVCVRVCVHMLTTGAQYGRIICMRACCRLIISVGCKTNTFNTPGIADREGKEVFFLKHLHHARQIRSRIVECFERADIPGTSPAETKRLLTFIVVGGGPVMNIQPFIAELT